MVTQRLAGLLIEEYEYAPAMSLIESVLRSQPRDAELRLVRAELLRRLAKFDDAIEEYRRILRLPNIDRDFVLGELGKACFEAGRLDQAKSTWRQVGHKLYAGTLLRNNGLVNEAIDVLREGIRIKPDDYALHRNLIRALHAAGKVDDALDAAKRLLDLEPDNVMNIRDLAKAYLERGNRNAATEVASRLFSAAVMEKKTGGAGGGSGSASYYGGGMSLLQQSMQSSMSMVGWGSGSMPRSNLDSAVQFFQENGLLGELQDVLTQQLEQQPDNAILRETAASLFNEFGKPELSLKLYRELETAHFPLEHQSWLGQCSQRDFYRLRQYQLIALKPALRDKRLAELEGKGVEKLTRDELIELGIVRQAQGLADKAIDVLQRAVRDGNQDTVALSVLITLLMSAERYADAEPHVQALTAALTGERERMATEMAERVRRDFVRSLPLPLQLRVTDDLLRDIAHKWTLGQSLAGDYAGVASTIGYFRARMIQATIFAKTNRMDAARKVWEELAPHNDADVEGFSQLASMVQMHDQSDLALQYYQQAMQAARKLAADPLLQRIFSGDAARSWFGDDREVIDSTFNQIVSAFAKSGKLIELCDFLRDTGQSLKARRVVQQYDLHEKLTEIYRQRVAEARAAFLKSPDSPLQKSVPYFAEVCKLAERLDQHGDWPAARKVYEDYLADFPDELALLTTLGEASEEEDEQDAAIEWEKKVIAAKERLSKRAREWSMREVALLPAKPQVLGDPDQQDWEWQQRWGKAGWWYYGAQQPLDVWSSWMRVARLYLALDNPIAAANAMERAIGAAGTNREEAAREILSLVKERQLGAQLLSVLRALAVWMPTDQPVQLAFADSLESNDKRETAVEVYQRMLRRGVSDLGVLAQVKQRLEALQPSSRPASSESSLASLEAEVAADPSDAGNRLRLAKAYYYSLEMDKALSEALKVFEAAPHLEGLHDLLIEIYTVKGDGEKLIDALKTKIARTADNDAKNKARKRLADELLSSGRTDEALAVLKELTDTRDPSSYERVGLLLHYFGKHDEAIEQFELASKSQNASAWGGDRGALMQVRSRIVKGDVVGAAKKLIDAVDQQNRQQMQMGGLAGMWNFGDMQQSPFQQFIPLFALEPKLTEEVQKRLTKEHNSDPDDPQAAKTLFQFCRAVGLSDQAEKLLTSLADRDVADQSLVAKLIDQAIEKRDFARAIKMAEEFIDQQPKPIVPPGLPPQMVGMMHTMSPRNVMLCKLGDIHWKLGDKEKAFETYRQILDEKIDESRMAFAGVCMMRDRVDEARKLVEAALAGQEVKSPGLLQFRAILAALANEPEKLYDDLARATEIGGATGNPYFGGDSAGDVGMLGRVAAETGQIDRFAEVLNKRIEKNPNDWSNYQLLAKTLRDAGRPKEAMAVVDRAYAVKAIKQEALTQRIQWLDGVAKAEEMIPLYEEAVTLAEKQAGSSNNRNRYGPYGYGGRETGGAEELRSRLGDLYWETGQHEKAEKAWTERLDPKNAETHVKMAARMLERPEYEKAAASYRKALELQPNHSQAHRALAELEFQAGNLEAALPHVREMFLRQYSSLISDPQQNQNNYRYYGPQYGGDDEEQNDPDARGDGWEMIRTIADELGRDPKIAQRLASATSEEDRDSRLALATIVGDWDAVETDLSGRLATQAYEPMVWRLWARCKERRGQWAEAVAAWDKVRRLKQTTLARRRDQLKLALAGKQVKEAAAGLKDEQNPGAAGGSMMGGGSRYYPGSNYYDYEGPAREEVQRLIGLYLKLGDFQKAEQLRLVSVTSNLSRALPELASVMWRRGAKERALELSRLGLTLADDANSAPQYAALLAQAGQVEAAVELLIRTYRCQAQDENYGNSYYSMYYYGNMGGGGQPELESGGEQQFAGALYELCRKHSLLDDTLKRLRDTWAQSPDDSRVGKLALSLLTRDRRWDEARATITAMRAKKPADLALLATLMRVQFQMHDWTAAGQSLDELRKLAPETAEQWRTTEAFVHLMQGDRKGAIAAVAPLLDDLPPSGNPLSAGQALVVLGVEDELPRLAEFLERARARGEFTPDGGLLLTRIYQLTGQWDKAAGVVLDEIWNNQTILALGHGALDALAGTIAAAAAAKVDLAASAKNTEDRALITMLRDGPAAGVEAFRKALAENPENLNARRGLVLAAELAADWKTAATACDETVAWLAPRRAELWRKPTPRSLQRLAHGYMQSMKASGINTSMVLGVGAAVGQLFGQVLDQNSSDDVQRREALSYDAAWRAYQAYAPRLAILAGDYDKALAHLGFNAAQARVSGSDDNNQYGNLQRRRYYAGGMTSYWYDDPYRRREQAEFERDSAKAMRRLLQETRQFGRLQAELDKLGPRVPVAEWNAAAQTCAALGRMDDARRWRRMVVDAELYGLKAADEAKLDTLSQWGWYYWYSGDNQESWQLRNALQARPRTPEQRESDRENPRGDGIAALGADDPAIGATLRDLLKSVPDGYGDSGIVAKLSSYFHAADEPTATLDLLERTMGLEGLMRSDRANAYVQACMEAKDYDRAEKFIDAVAARNSSLDDDVCLARLTLLRLRGKSAEADALERELVGRCRFQPKPASRMDDRLLTSRMNLGMATTGSRYRQRSTYLRGDSLRQQTISLVAQVLGAQYEDDVGYQDMTLPRIASRYEGRGLYADAVRMNREYLKTMADSLTPGDVANLQMEIAGWLAKAGQNDEARTLAAELEAKWTQAAATDPSDAGPLTRLLSLYTSKTLGPDHAKALEVSARLRKIRPEPGVSDSGEALTLFELKRPAEAWASYQTIIARGRPMSPGMLLRAGLSAARSGHAAEAAELLREGLWLSPRHPLAAEAKEMLHE
ncbi:MAG: tetratricopeptide repeat protein [Planctomycetes bacterium]|nr:tetratricopeptide repeat protein [Planctomycetota bacterium]